MATRYDRAENEGVIAITCISDGMRFLSQLDLQC